MKTQNISKLTAAACLMLLFISCNTKPQPIAYGKDICDFCKMGIVDPKFGGELITKKGKIYKFDDLVCMMRFMKKAQVKEEDLGQKLVINHQKQNDFIDVSKAFFVINPEFNSPMGSDAAGFQTQQEAEKFKPGTAKVLNWTELYNQSE